jgi:hypothetical protein
MSNRYFTRVHPLWHRYSTQSYGWIVLIDDDSLLFLSSLLRTLSTYDPSIPHVLGGISESTTSIANHGQFAYGGGGMVLSKAALGSIQDSLDCCQRAYEQLYGGDEKLARCLADLGVPFHHIPAFHQMDIRGQLAGYIEGIIPHQAVISMHHVYLYENQLFPPFPASTMTGLNEKQVAVKQFLMSYHQLPMDQKENFCLSRLFYLNLYEDTEWWTRHYRTSHMHILSKPTETQDRMSKAPIMSLPKSIETFFTFFSAQKHAKLSQNILQQAYLRHITPQSATIIATSSASPKMKMTVSLDHHTRKHHYTFQWTIGYSIVLYESFVPFNKLLSQVATTFSTWNPTDQPLYAMRPINGPAFPYHYQRYYFSCLDTYCMHQVGHIAPCEHMHNYCEIPASAASRNIQAPPPESMITWNKHVYTLPRGEEGLMIHLDVSRGGKYVVGNRNETKEMTVIGKRMEFIVVDLDCRYETNTIPFDLPLQYFSVSMDREEEEEGYNPCIQFISKDVLVAH